MYNFEHVDNGESVRALVKINNCKYFCFCFNVQPFDFAVYLRSGIPLGVLIMTFSMWPLLRDNYEVILLHTCI